MRRREDDVAAQPDAGVVADRPPRLVRDQGLVEEYAVGDPWYKGTEVGPLSVPIMLELKAVGEVVHGVGGEREMAELEEDDAQSIVLVQEEAVGDHGRIRELRAVGVEAQCLPIRPRCSEIEVDAALKDLFRGRRAAGTRLSEDDPEAKIE